MGFTSTLRAVLDMDTTPFAAGAKRGESLAQDMAGTIVRTARQSAAAFQEIAAAEKNLSEQRRTAALASADDLGKIKILQNELIQLAKQRSSAEAGTADKLNAQAGIVSRLAQIRGIRSQGGASSLVPGEYAPSGVSDAARKLADNAGKADSLFSKIAAKFSSGSILTSVLGGVGLGSGFAIAEKAAGMISSYWEKSAESAKRIAEFSDRQTTAVLRLINLRATDEQKLIKARSREESLMRQYSGSRAADNDPERTAELLAQYQEAAADRAELEIKAQEKIKEAREKAAKEEKERVERDLLLKIASGERQRERDKEAAASREKSDKEIADATREANRLELEAAAKKTATVDLLNAAEAESVIIQAHLLSLDEKSLEFQKSRQDLANADLKIDGLKKKFFEEERKHEEAVNKILKSRSDLAAGNRDRVSFGLDDAAGGGRGTGAEQRRAREIQRLEAQARRAYDRGSQTTERRDARGNRIVETGEQESARKLAEADALRGGFGNRLNSAERDPLKTYKEALAESEKRLKEIADSLAQSSDS